MFRRSFVFGSRSRIFDTSSEYGNYAGENQKKVKSASEAQEAMVKVTQTEKAPGKEVSDVSDCTYVRASDLYSPEKGYGFVTELNRREQELLKLPELNSAFEPVYWYQNRELTHIEEDAYGCFLDSDREIACLEREAGGPFDGERRRIPLSFKSDVPRQGNYKVTVTIPQMATGSRMVTVPGEEAAEKETPGKGTADNTILEKQAALEENSAKETPEEVIIFTGRRRLGYHGDIHGSTGLKSTALKSTEAAEEGFTYSMTVNVCDIVPRGHTEVYEDKTLDITILASRPGISSVTIEELDCPTVFIAGDSTVTDQSGEYPYAPGTSYCGWGQMISAYFTDRLAVSNHAHSGLTTHTFRQEGHYGIVEKYIRPGDYYFCQFGHNDQKLAELKAEEGYKANLIRYIQECREKGVFPVLITPIARNTWKGNDGTYNDLLEEYADTCVRLGEQEDIPVLDLHGRSMEFIVEKGLEASKAYFFPGDYTHSNDYGAYYMAGLVAEEIVRVCGARKEPEYRFLAECVRSGGFGAWPPGERIVPLRKPETPEKESGAEEVQNAGEELLLSEVENLTEPADRASALDMIIKTVRFFPTNVYNDMFTDVVGHEWFAGTVECAYQNGMIDPGLVEEGRFFPLRPVTLEEFLVFAVNGYKSRKNLPAGYGDTPCRYDEECREFTRPYMRAACVLGWIGADGSAAPGQVITRGQAVEICRKMKV